MFDSQSRYAALEKTTTTLPDGRMAAYVRRRFLPQGANLPLLQQTTVLQGERLDLLTARTLGDPEQFWRVADANNAMNPIELTEAPGRMLRVPVPQPGT